VKINKIISQPSFSPHFKGYQHTKSNEGNQGLKFNYTYDDSKWNCAVEFYKVDRVDADYSYHIKKQGKKVVPFKTVPLDYNGTVVETGIDGLNLKENEAVAYRYKLTSKDKNNPKVIYTKDDADAFHSALDDNGFNLITRKCPSPMVQGSMNLQMPDTYNTGYIHAGFNAPNTGEIIKDPNAKDVSNFSRNFSNKAGGTLAGMEEKLPELKKAGYKKVISLPTTGADTLSSHKYWPARPFQTENMDAWNSLMTSCFKNGLSYVIDEALTSQGLEGVNFQYALKWMNSEDKPHEFYMFRMKGLEDAALSLGEVPANSKNLRHKIVNGINDYEVQPNGQVKIKANPDYDASLPTYINIYDDSLVSEEQRNDKKNIIRDYAKTNPTYKNADGSEDVNTLAINLHDDTLVPYAHKIDPFEYDANIKNLNIINNSRDKNNKIAPNSPLGTLVLAKFSSIEIRPKEEGGFDCWDANTDMAKLSYAASDYDVQLLRSISNPKERSLEYEKLERAHAGNRDVLADNVRFYARNVRLLQNEYTAKTLGKLNNKGEEQIENRINKLVYDRNNQKLPDEVVLNQEEISNIELGFYNSRDKESNATQALTKALMEYPLDGVELGSDIVGALSSPYLSKRSPDMDHVGISRYDAMKDSTYKVPQKYEATYEKMNNIYKKQMTEFAKNVLRQVDLKSEEKIFEANDGDTLTEYGQHIVPIVAQDIAKYALIKSLAPGARSKELRNGKITYDYETLKYNTSLKSVGVVGDSPEDEANQLANKIKKGIENLSTTNVREVAHSINKRLEGTDTMSFKLAEAMVDKAGLGLEVRVDAAKDYADMDAVRSLQDLVDNQYAENIDILAPMVKALKDENPAATLYAEYTNSGDLMYASYQSDSGKDDSRFKHAGFLENQVLAETGINTVANYSHFFTSGLNLFGKDFTNGNSGGGISDFYARLGEFANMPEEYKKNTYTFGGNHDKPRMAECYGMDMGLFHADLTKPENQEARKRAYMIMNNKLDNGDINEDDYNIINGSKNPEFFNNISSKSIAKAEWLKTSFGIANEILKNKEKKGKSSEEQKQIDQKYAQAFNSMSVALGAIVRGDYYMNGANENKDGNVVDSYKKQLEKDGFGTKDLPTALNIVLNQAKNNSVESERFPNGINMKDFKQLTTKAALGIPLKKVRMYTELIHALPGNPTIFAGDDLGMTGYDEKCHNWHLNSRNRTPWEVIDPKNPEYNPMIAAHKAEMDKIVASRKHDSEHKLSALNGGTMFRIANTYAGKDLCPAILAQGADGSLAVSVFNFNGDLHTRDLKNIVEENGVKVEKPIENESDLDNAIKQYDVRENHISRLYLNSDKTINDITLNSGLEFKNVNATDTTIYKTYNEYDEASKAYKTYIAVEDEKAIKENREDKGKPIILDKKTAPNGVLKLYCLTQAAIANGKKIKELENKYTTPVPNAAANAYASKKEEETGKQLSIVAK